MIAAASAAPMFSHTFSRLPTDLPVPSLGPSGSVVGADAAGVSGKLNPAPFGGLDLSDPFGVLTLPTEGDLNWESDRAAGALAPAPPSEGFECSFGPSAPIGEIVAGPLDSSTVLNFGFGAGSGSVAATGPSPAHAADGRGIGIDGPSGDAPLGMHSSTSSVGLLSDGGSACGTSRRDVGGNICDLTSIEATPQHQLVAAQAATIDPRRHDIPMMPSLLRQPRPVMPKVQLIQAPLDVLPSHTFPPSPSGRGEVTAHPSRKPSKSPSSTSIGGQTHRSQPASVCLSADGSSSLDSAGCLNMSGRRSGMTLYGGKMEFFSTVLDTTPQRHVQMDDLVDRGRPLFGNTAPRRPQPRPPPDFRQTEAWKRAFAVRQRSRQPRQRGREERPGGQRGLSPRGQSTGPMPRPRRQLIARPKRACSSHSTSGLSKEALDMLDAAAASAPEQLGPLPLPPLPLGPPAGMPRSLSPRSDRLEGAFGGCGQPPEPWPPPPPPPPPPRHPEQGPLHSSGPRRSEGCDSESGTCGGAELPSWSEWDVPPLPQHRGTRGEDEQHQEESRQQYHRLQQERLQRRQQQQQQQQPPQQQQQQQQQQPPQHQQPYELQPTQQSLQTQHPQQHTQQQRSMQHLEQGCWQQQQQQQQQQ
eukprot:CAMPEP_0115409552 /NCGR_PEP_ID=MMETSP0271-20121206/20065_1 /TAXON_ID=71861 /ORGANISM="Scrippsiella trochoidea, Strain CCMP3099" /LENGTH=639 /DNA_ID=CAMNT_0002833707 /DNA_START=83 /DNA_END=1999 /DNA_ORIENTATION=+